MTPEEIIEWIKKLRVDQLVELNRLLEEWPKWGEGGAGVREPVGPLPESPGDSIALEIE